MPDIGLVEPTAIEGLPNDVRNLIGKAFYIRPFDRKADGGRIHTEDFGRANGIELILRRPNRRVVAQRRR